MKSGTRPVKGTRKMIANMTPVLQPGTYVFCTMLNTEDATAAATLALATFAEDEGMSLVLEKSEADRLGLSYGEKMRRITLMVYSSVSGVGLTAAVAGELARHRIPANVVAATQHDHVFVPKKHADRALEALRVLQARARDGQDEFTDAD